MAKNRIVISSRRRVSAKVQKRIGSVALQQVGKIVVVRTFFGTFIGCLRSVGTFSILLRVFTGFNRTFVTISIPRSIIFDLFVFPCP